MQLRGPKTRGVSVAAASLSVVVWLAACGDDAETTDEQAATSDADEHAHQEQEAGASGDSSGGGMGGSATKKRADDDAPSSSDGAGGAGGAGSKDRKPSQPTPAKASDSDEHDATSGEASTRKRPGSPNEVGDEDAGVGTEGSADAGAEPENVKVAIRFKAKVGDQDFACGHKYPGQGSTATTVTPRDLRLFVHDLALIAADGTKVPVRLNPRAPWQSDTLALLDFEDGSGRCEAGTKDMNTAITGSAPTGTYSGVSFVVGVPEELNHTDPATVSDPLTAAGMHWSWLAGYRFARVEMVQPAAPGEPFGIGLFHPGSTGCSGSTSEGTVTCAKPNRSVVTLEGFDPDKSSVVIDVAELFGQLDLTQSQECHSTEPACDSMFASYGVAYATGDASGGQTLFRVE